jgi:hypothetical protein
MNEQTSWNEHLAAARAKTFAQRFRYSTPVVTVPIEQ